MRMLPVLLVLFAVTSCDTLDSKCNETRTKAMTTIVALGKCKTAHQAGWDQVMNGTGKPDQKLVSLITVEAARDACETGAWNASGLAAP